MESVKFDAGPETGDVTSVPLMLDYIAAIFKTLSYFLNVNSSAAPFSGISVWGAMQLIPKNINITTGITSFLKKDNIYGRLLRYKISKFRDFKL